MEEQLRQKEAWVKECIGQYGPVESIIRMKNAGRYRNKVTAVFGLDAAGRPVCGKYKAGSRDLVGVRDCLIEDRRASHIVQTIWSLLPSFRYRVYDDASRLGMLRAVQVRCAHATGQIMVTIVTNGPAFPSKNHFVKALLEKEPSITTIVQNINERTDAMVLGQTERTLYGPGYIEDVLCGKRFLLSSRSFYQVNSLQTEKLYHIAIDMAGLSGKETVVDAYCGIGTIGICAADRAGRLIGVELNPSAAADARRNAERNQLAGRYEVVTGDAGEFMEGMAEQGASCDVLFLDPPRAGATAVFLRSILQLRPARIVYISCNPVTLAENLSVLCGGGYQMAKAVPVDMFPFTDHVEVVAAMSRKA